MTEKKYNHEKILEEFGDYFEVRMDYLESEECDQNNVATISKIAELYRAWAALVDRKSKHMTIDELIEEPKEAEEKVKKDDVSGDIVFRWKLVDSKK